MGRAYRSRAGANCRRCLKDVTFTVRSCQPMLRDALKSRKTHVLAAGLAFYVGWQIWLTLAAPGKIAADFPAPAERVDILVTLPFAPERFHVQLFQAYGRVSGTRDNAIEVRGVKRADLTSVARPYWVRRVEPLPPGG